MSEQEIKRLKEELKKEILAEMNTKKENENNWKKIKIELEQEFDNLDYINHWECLNANNELISKNTKVSVKYPLQNAIGTILRIVYKAENVSKINANYEDMKSIVEQIFNILKQNRKELEYE